MIIVIEGADGVGKTTLARYLCKELGARYLHAGFDPSWNIFNYHVRILYRAVRMVIKTGKPVVVDRLWLSEAVYAEVFRGGTPWGLQGRLFQRVLGRVGGTYVMCLTNDPTGHRRRMKKLRGERFEMFEDVQKVSELYEKVTYGRDQNFRAKVKPSYLEYLIRNDGLLGKKQLNVVLYDESRWNDLKSVLDEVRDRLTVTSCNFPLLDDYKIFNGVGNTVTSKYLLLGDVPNANKANRRFNWPFFEYRNSSLYLTKVLNDLGLPEEKIFIININDTYGVEMTRKWLEYKQSKKISPTIICMGRLAAMTFEAEFSKNVGSKFKYINYYLTYHPQVARRFPKYAKKFKRELRQIFKGGIDGLS